MITHIKKSFRLPGFVSEFSVQFKLILVLEAVERIVDSLTCHTVSLRADRTVEIIYLEHGFVPRFQKRNIHSVLRSVNDLFREVVDRRRKQHCSHCPRRNTIRHNRAFYNGKSSALPSRPPSYSDADASHKYPPRPTESGESPLRFPATHYRLEIPRD